MIFNNNLQFQYAKYQEQILRMTNSRKAIDFYNNNSSLYIESAINNIYTLGKLTYKKFLRKFPVTTRLINKQSILFKQPVVINYEGSDKLKLLFKNILNDSLFNSMLITVNRLVNLVGKVGIIPKYYNGIIIYDILTPDKCIIKQVLNYPTLIELLYYVINNNTDTILLGNTNVNK